MYDDSGGEPYHAPLTPGSNQSRHIGPLIQFGPIDSPDLDSWLRTLRGYDNSAGHAEVVGQDIILGRPVVVIEYGHESDYDAGGGVRYSTGLGRMWVDPDRMLILRNETDSGRFVAQVTALDWEPSFSDGQFLFQAPAGVTPAATLPTSPTLPNPHDSAARLWPAYPRAGYVPEGMSLTSTRLQQAAVGAVDVTLDYGFDGSGGSPAFTIEEHVRADGVPPPLVTNDATTVAGHLAYRAALGTTHTLAWAQDGFAIVISSDTLPPEDMERIAGSMTVQ